MGANAQGDGTQQRIRRSCCEAVRNNEHGHIRRRIARPRERGLRRRPHLASDLRPSQHAFAFNMTKKFRKVIVVGDVWLRRRRSFDGAPIFVYDLPLRVHAHPVDNKKGARCPEMSI